MEEGIPVERCSQRGCVLPRMRHSDLCGYCFGLEQRSNEIHKISLKLTKEELDKKERQWARTLSISRAPIYKV